MAEPDITVVGAGFVGLSFAIAAGQRGYQVAVVDQKTAPVMPAETSSNVIAVNAASSAFLRALGVWQTVPERFRPAYDAMTVTDGTGTGRISFTADEADLPELGHIVDQSALLAALAQVAEVTAGVALDWEQSPEVSDMASPLIVGADGRHSRIREFFGIRQISYDYKQTATVCLASFEQPHNQCARQWFLSSGPVALLPLAASNQVAVVWSSFDDLMALAETDFRTRLLDATEGELGDLLHVGKRFSFPLVQQHALHYCGQGVALLGDAAHAIHPLAGQGANLGFADARALAQELAGARLEGLSPGDEKVLKRYEQARRVHNRVAALGMEGFHRLFTADVPAIGLLRNLGLGLADRSSSLKKLAIDLASGH